MEYPKILLGLIGVSVLLLVVSFLGKRAEWFLNLVLRSVFGTILICFCLLYTSPSPRDA